VAFREIREEKDFFDCTLSVGTRQIQAHKLILSACSPFFRSILRQNPHQHPLLYLKGVEFTDLQSVLNFMYHGEVNVAQEELNSFLAVAEDLQVKGLTQGEGSKDKQNHDDAKPRQLRDFQEQPRRSRPPAAPAPPTPPQPPPPPRMAPSYNIETNDDIQEVMPIVKSEPESNIIAYTAEPSHQPIQSTNMKYQPPAVPMQSQQVVQAVDDTYYEGEDNYDYAAEYGGYEAEQLETDTSKGSGLNMENIEAFISEGEKGFTCELCGKCLGKFRQSCKRHIKLVHMSQGTKIKCGSCDQFFKNRESLKTHERIRHNIYATGY